MKVLRIAGVVVAVLLLITVALYLTGYGQKIFMAGVQAYYKPAGDFDAASQADAPNYADSANWAALPATVDAADLVPAGIDAIDGQRPVDTFFIHPTGFLKSSSWTSPMNPQSATEENTTWMMANQASAYNGCCNVYAPRYREATIFAYLGDPTDRDTLLGFAYQDVKRAFDYYLQHYNQGRPFIIASHSQGTHHARLLLRDVIDNSELHQRMVAAYLIGSVNIALSPSWFQSMANITPCESADSLHCVVHWDTLPAGAAPVDRPEPSLCTNPLSWRVDEQRVAASMNAGAVVPAGTYNMNFGGSDDSATGQRFESLSAPVPGQTWAQCENGSLYVESQQGNDFSAMGSGEMDSYHGLDYALFYMNIRNNAQLRAASYLGQQATD